MSEEGLRETANRMVHIGKPIEYDSEAFTSQLQELYELCESESGDIREKVREIVPAYQWVE